MRPSATPIPVTGTTHPNPTSPGRWPNTTRWSPRFEDFGCEVVFHDAPLPDHADAIFTHDPVIVTDSGAVILRMGKAQRRGEEAAIAASLETLGVPILATLEDEATAEGGDLLWLDHDTLAVGRGFRTNAEGLRQLTAALRPLGVKTIEVQLPHAGGPAACLHLMSLISMLDDDLAVVHLPLLPVPFVELLGDRGIELVEVPESEVPTMGPNVLALAPRRCLAIEGNPVTRGAPGSRRLRGAHLPRPRALAQSRGRRHLPHAADPAILILAPSVDTSLWPGLRS